jgi:hypothetical protein
MKSSLNFKILFLFLLLLNKFCFSQNPSTITGLKLWLLADSGITQSGANVTSWADNSGNANNAQQSNINAQPILATNVLNGRSAIHFNGNTFLNGNTISGLSTSSLTIFVVASGGAMSDSYNVLFDIGPYAPGGMWLSKNTQDFTIYSNNAIYSTTSSLLYNTGFDPKIFQYKKQFGVSAESYLNTLLLGSSSDAPFINAFVNGAYAVGGDPTYYGLWNGNVFEIILFDRLLSTTENTIVNNYLASRYAPILNLGADVAILSNIGCVPSTGTTLTVNAVFKDYLWNTGDTSKQITVNQYGTYSVITTDNFNIKHYDTIKVTPSLAVYNYPTTAICVGSNIIWNTNLSHANYSFQWSNGSTDSLLNITNAGNYAVHIADNSGCIYISDTIKFVMDTFSTYATLGIDTALCVGNTIQLKKGAAQAVSYLWNTTDTTPNITISTGGQYTLQANNSNGCVVNDTINITLLGTAPIANFSYNNNCVGNSINCINTSVPPSGASITTNNWAINYGGITGNGVNFNPLVNDTLTYLVTLNISSSNGCSNSVQKNIKIYNQPKVSITALNSCTNDSTQLKALPLLQGNVFDYYQWTTPSAAIITTANTSIKQYITTGGNSTYTLQLYTTNGCSATTTKNIYTYQAPDVAIDIKNNCDNNQVICIDKTNYHGPYTALNGTWKIQGVDSTNYSNYYFKNLAQGNYTISLNVQASNGCKGMYSKPFEVYALPIANYDVSNNCANNKALFTYVNTPSNAPIKQYNWLINTTNTYGGTTINYLINSTLDSLPVTLTVIDTNNCKGVIANKVKIHTAPQAEFTNDLSANYDLPTTIHFNNTSTNATYYSWFVNDVPASTSALNYTLNATTENNYNLKLVTKNMAQCADSVTQGFELSKRINDVMLSNVSVTENNGYAQVSCLLTNLGNRTLQRLQLYAQVAGNDAVNEEWAGNIISGETIVYTLASKLRINTLKKYNDAVCVWATTPNNFDDADASNNRACVALATQDDFRLSTIYQNTETKSITLSVISKTPTTAHLTVNDMSGKIIVENTKLNLTQVYNEVFIDLSKFATGIYKYSIDNGTQKLTGSFYAQ